jgi:hypothetical protein
MDLRCAISQSEEMFGAHAVARQDRELIRFPEESHDISRGGRPDRRVERLKRIAVGSSSSSAPRSEHHAEVEVDTQVLATPQPAATDEETVEGVSGRRAVRAAVEPRSDSEAIVLAPEVETYDLPPSSARGRAGGGDRTREAEAAASEQAPLQKHRQRSLPSGNRSTSGRRPSRPLRRPWTNGRRRNHRQPSRSQPPTIGRRTQPARRRAGRRGARSSLHLNLLCQSRPC